MSAGGAERSDDLSVTRHFIDKQDDGVRARRRQGPVPDFAVFLTKLMAMVACGVYFLYAVIASEVWRKYHTEPVPVVESLCQWQSGCNATDCS